ncbi:MAG: 2-(1,2-epoxy-1,2-dihydrophenyl)acetyl-CoA isomerase [Thermoplasmata archaeon]|nr:MAG: 2-(1,2-epoxy-1,2-dihydrophenyl)acetyl-CoA isomerase [Thermoplasmata archaeon]RLF37152.1 MAG: 2-(1,2-epoxy-1,2-dihydrophenyl)acetyl-CoA isomerase [Thermoplasmata archaeon]
MFSYITGKKVVHMECETLEMTLRDQIAYITLNRPSRLNAFDLTLGRELYNTLCQISNDPKIRVLIIKGTGKGFCGGGDVKEMYNAENKTRFLRELTRAIHKCVIEIRNMQKPVIAAVNGIAYGAGLSLALACDIIVASKDARMSTAFIGIGLTPGCGTQFITNLVGYHRACELIFTSKTFTAQEALRMGIVNKVVDPDMLDDAVEEYALMLKRNAPIAMGMAKKLINESMRNDMISHLELESLMASQSAATQDFVEGITAFMEKRQPVFRGK